MAKAELLLGKNAAAGFEYNPKILTPIERTMGRAGLKMHSFSGYDVWRLYELTYLDLKGIPHCATGTLSVPAHSPYIIESKSLKLYLGSFTQTKLTGLAELEAIIRADLKRKLKVEVSVTLTDTSNDRQPFSELFLQGEHSKFSLIDLHSAELEPISSYHYAPEELFSTKKEKKKTIQGRLYSNLLHTLCPVTGQPDHATVFISFSGEQIPPVKLLAYLISLREYQGFHEQACELIFSDLMHYFKLEELCVLCCFTRRGGIDINPLRCTPGYSFAIPRTFRQ